MVAACSSKEKGDFCRRLGAHHVVEYGSGEEAAKVRRVSARFDRYVEFGASAPSVKICVRCRRVCSPGVLAAAAARAGR